MNEQHLPTKAGQGPQGQGQKYATIKLGLDVHADSIVVVRILDNTAPQPAQRFSEEGFLEWVKKQLKEAQVVHSCYEAGPFGYGLHRRLIALGVKNVVVQPVCLDERRTGVNHDKSDAQELSLRLDRYVVGNTKSLAIVRVPTPEEEQRRVVTRQREQLTRERKRLAAQGRGLMLAQGFREKGPWWRGARWNVLQGRLPEWLRQALERYQRMLVCVEEERDRIDGELESRPQGARPKGMGPLTSEVVDREVGDWRRFANRRQVGSYTGLCGGVSSSGLSHRQLSVTKHGNVRLRTALVELAWRMVVYQPQSRLVQKWRSVFGNPRATAGARKKAIVAMARQIAVDLWRWKTGRAKPEDLGWVMMEA
jgi:transposase